MNIAIDIRELCAANTGIGQYTRNLLNYLTKNHNNHIFFLFTNKGISPENLPENFKFIKYNANNFFFDLIALPQLLKKYRITALFSAYYKFPPLTKTPAIITVHDIGFITFPIQFYARSRFYRLFAAKYLAYSLKNSAHIFAVSQFTKNEIIQHYKIAEQKITVLYNTVNTIFDISIKKKFAVQIQKLTDKFGSFILSVSNYKPHKNINCLINAYHKIHKNISENLILAGPKSDRMNECLELVKSLNLEKRVFFVTPADNHELSLFYSAAQIYCHPSMYEGFGLPPVEAQRCGAPVISSRAASLKEILADSAILFDPYNENELAEKLNFLCADKNLQNQLIIKGLTNAERFTPEKIYPDFFKIAERFEI